MRSEIRLAFAHPSERAEATAEDAPLDRISLRDHVVEVEIGAFQAERGVTQRVCFNIVVEVRPLHRPINDDVDRILSYDRVTEAIAAELAAERLNLLETLAERIAARILAAPQAVRTFVRIEKLDRGPGALGVEIVRSRPQESAPRPHGDERPAPVVVYVGNPAIASPHLSGWLDQLEAMGRPLVLCVGPPETPRPRSAHPLVQRRIDLLAIEQNAWVLAERDHRCVVVSTRTELDWAAANRQTSVWAPSKLVLDAVDGPPANLPDALALATWFAATSAAQEMIVIGADGPADPPLPVRTVPAKQSAL